MRSVRVIISALAAIAVLGVVAKPAAAGGNWIEWKRRYNVVGETVVARNIFFARSEAKVRRGGPYYAYLSPETYGWQLSNVDRPGTIRLGRVKVIWPGPDSKFRGFLRFNPRARIRFTVPDLPSGDYLIAFCNLRCTRTLGDVDPTGWFSVVHSPLERRLTRRLDILSSRLRDMRYRARNSSGRAERSLEGDLTDIGSDAYEMQRRVQTLQGRLAKLRRDEAGPGLVPWISFTIAAAFLCLAAIAAGLFRRHQRDERPTDAKRSQEVPAGFRGPGDGLVPRATVAGRSVSPANGSPSLLPRSAERSPFLPRKRSDRSCSESSSAPKA